MWSETFSTDIIKEIRTVDTIHHRPTHASAFLVWYAKPTRDVKNVIELGSGTGIVALSMAKLYNVRVDGVELQPHLCELAQKGAELNGVSELVKFYNIDVRDVKKHFRPESYDMVVSNLPFHIGRESPYEEKKISKSATLELIDAFIEATAYLLKNKGTFVFVCSPKITVYMIEHLALKKLIVQRLGILYGAPGKNPKIVALRGKKNGGYELVITSHYANA
ncbi:tRNA1(Val) (adenine(37)-N6)-methyltransferase [Fervidobacterium thailandense]|uniref:Methyltransferase n=1 Tax=Fervidobacterium thailandense TaxID=1008305 RepID=A0A1E3G464_9BACT|nr:methyltransferase [Fervidobacterium thailandense]ODN31076.1 methyltransferase [Fervidobacterium thailandense]